MSESNGPPSLEEYAAEHLDGVLERLRLTPQERKITMLVFAGASAAEAARARSIVPATARAHLRSVQHKLDVRDRSELAHLLARILWRHRQAPHLFLHLRGWRDLL